MSLVFILLENAASSLVWTIFRSEKVLRSQVCRLFPDQINFHIWRSKIFGSSLKLLDGQEIFNRFFQHVFCIFLGIWCFTQKFSEKSKAVSLVRNLFGMQLCKAGSPLRASQEKKTSATVPFLSPFLMHLRVFQGIVVAWFRRKLKNNLSVHRIFQLKPLFASYTPAEKSAIFCDWLHLLM